MLGVNTRLTITAVGLLFCGLVSGLQAGTISYWRFEGDLTDSVGTHDVSASSGVGFTGSGLWDPVPNPENGFDENTNAGDFGATDGSEYAEVPDNADWTQTGGFTIEAMVNMSGTTYDEPETLVSHWGSAAADQSWVFEIDNANAPQLRLSGTGGDATAAFSSSEFSLETGKVYALAAAFDGSAVTLYAKEKGAGSSYLSTSAIDVSSIGTLKDSGDVLRFGQRSDDSFAFGGTMDEIRFSSGALSEAELLATPEPTTTCLAIAAAAAGVFAIWRKKRRETPEDEAA